MIPLSDLLTATIPFVALIISIVSAYANSRHRSVDLAIKYSSYLKDVDGDSLSTFDQVVKEEGKLAASYYMWKSFSRLTEHKRSTFNYISFLVFTFGWIGMAIVSLFKTYDSQQSVPAFFIAGTTIMLLAVALMSYQRYESNLYSRFLKLRKSGSYLESAAAVYKAKEEVLGESIPAASAALTGAALAAYYLDGNTVALIWNVVILACALGNNFEPVIKNRKVRDQASSTGSTQAAEASHPDGAQ